MRSKVVLWGENNEGKKVLIGMSLKASENEVDVFTFDESIVTESFYNILSSKWKDGEELEFPEGFQKTTVPLTVSGALLPEGIKADNPEIIQRAQTQWQFSVLSSRLNESFKSELDLIKDKIEAAKEYSQDHWNELKGVWEKIQVQIKEKNLFGEYIDGLKSSVNELFDSLKNTKKDVEKKFNENSSKVKDGLMSDVQEVEDKMQKGLSLQPLFEELKKIQGKFKGSDLSHSDRKSVWDKLDNAFKELKNKKYGKQGGAASSDNPVARITNRYNGLIQAIEKMERSISFDEKDLNESERRNSTSHNQLESQIREAKIRIINDRVVSKKEKLEEMLKTKADLEQRIEKLTKAEKAKEEKEAALKIAQENIASKIKAASEARSEHEDVLEKAAGMILESKTTPESEATIDAIDEGNESENSDQSILGTIGSMLGESLKDVVDTARAVGEVLGDKLEDKLQDIKEAISGDHQDDKVDDENKSEEILAGDNVPETVDIKVYPEVNDAPVDEDHQIIAVTEEETNNDSENMVKDDVSDEK